MEIRTLKISELQPADYNPRKDLKPEDREYQKIRDSVEEFGLVEPFVINQRTGNIISGHQRLKVLQELGETEVEVVVIDCDEKEEKKLNLSLNKIKGQWDREKLSAVLQELDEQGLAGLAGFDDWELAGLIDVDDMLDGILDYEIPEEDESEQDAQSEEEQHVHIDFTIPEEYADEVDDYLRFTENAHEELADAVIIYISGMGVK